MMKKVSDRKIVCVWYCYDEDCMIGNNHETANVNPDWYQYHGTPVCLNCNKDMEYSHTEVDCG